MNAITENLRSRIREKSLAIYELKQSCLKYKTKRRWAYVQPDGTVYDGPWGQWPEGTKGQYVEYQVVCDHIKPEHFRWSEYKDLKYKASLLFTALLISKGEGFDPAKAGEFSEADVNAALMDQRNRAHGIQPYFSGDNRYIMAAIREAAASMAAAS